MARGTTHAQMIAAWGAENANITAIRVTSVIVIHTLIHVPTTAAAVTGNSPAALHDSYLSRTIAVCAFIARYALAGADAVVNAGLATSTSPRVRRARTTRQVATHTSADPSTCTPTSTAGSELKYCT